MRLTVRYLQNRNGWYRYRREVPRDVRKAIGVREWIVPLKTDSASTAAALVSKLDNQYGALIARVRAGEPAFPVDIDLAGQHARDVLALEPRKRKAAITAYTLHAAMEAIGADHAKTVLDAVDNGGVVQVKSMTLKAAYARDKEKYGGARDEARIKYAVDAFVEMVGDIDFLHLKRAEVEKWALKARARGWAEATVKRRTVALQGIHSRLLISLDRPLSSVWRKLGLRDSGEEAKLPLNVAHLAALDAHLLKQKPQTQQMFALMRYLGLGPKELGGLLTRDIVLDHPTPHVIVRANEGRGLKTTTRGRSLPLIGAALKAAKAAFADANGREMLFLRSGETLNANGLSQRLAKVMRAAGIPKSRRLSPYSLRHGFAEALKLAKVRDGLVKYAMGHAGSGMTDRYGASAPQLAELSKEMKRALRYFGRVDDSIYEPSELLPLDIAARS